MGPLIALLGWYEGARWLHPLDRPQKEATDRDRFQRADSEAQDSPDRHRVRELLAVRERLSWRTYLKNKRRHNL
jgi:hypothetical protein